MLRICSQVLTCAYSRTKVYSRVDAYSRVSTYSSGLLTSWLRLYKYFTCMGPFKKYVTRQGGVSQKMTKCDIGQGGVSKKVLSLEIYCFKNYILID